MITAAAPADGDGWYSLSLHAGVTEAELHAAAADPRRLLIVEASAAFPRTIGEPGSTAHALHRSEIDILVESEASPVVVPERAPTDAQVAIATHAKAFVPDGATLQTGIGAVPSIVAGILADGDGGDYGIHTEVFTDGLMGLHATGKVTNRRPTPQAASTIHGSSGGSRRGP